MRGDFVGEPEALGAVAAALNDSTNPALVVGAGVDRDGAWDAVVALAERTGATVWVSPLSGRCSFPEDHPAFAGFLTPAAARLAEQLAPPRRRRRARRAGVHVSRARPTGAQWSPTAPSLFLLTDDPDAAAFAPVGAAILTTLRRGIAELLGRVTQSERTPAGRAAATHAAAERSDLRRVRDADRERGDARERGDRRGGAVASQRDARPPSHPAQRRLLLRRERRARVGAARVVGIALGDPSRRIVCLLGDGSSLYSIQALWTAAEHTLPITFVILNNRGYSALKAFGLAMGIETLPGVNLPGLELREPRDRVRGVG